VSLEAARCSARLRQRLRRSRQDQQRWGLTATMKNVSILVYVLAGYDSDAAATYARRARSGRKAVKVCAEDAPPVLDWFLEADVHELIALLTADTPGTLVTQASKFLAEYYSVKWVHAENFQRGKAPDSAALFQKYNACRTELGLAPMCAAEPPRPGRHARLGRTARKACRRMAFRWRMSRGSILPSEPMSREEVVLKARGSMPGSINCCRGPP
jgi:hypothetical protein